MEVKALNPQSRQEFTFSNTGYLNDAIKVYGYIPMRDNGTPFVTQPFAGGYVIDGSPLNVYIEERWFDGQKELLQPEWVSGRIPQPSADILNIGSVPMPPDVAATYQASQQGIFGSIPTPVLIGGAALLAWKFLK